MINKQRVKRIKNVIYTVMVILLFLPLVLLIALSISMISFLRGTTDSLNRIENYIAYQENPVIDSTETPNAENQSAQQGTTIPATAANTEKDGNNQPDDLADEDQPEEPFAEGQPDDDFPEPVDGTDPDPEDQPETNTQLYAGNQTHTVGSDQTDELLNEEDHPQEFESPLEGNPPESNEQGDNWNESPSTGAPQKAGE